MEKDLPSLLADKLELLKEIGLVTEYLVVGAETNQPLVVGWSMGFPASHVRRLISTHLAGVVALQRIEVIAEPPPIVTTRATRRLIARVASFRA
jgi:hypothetical protein